MNKCNGGTYWYIKLEISIIRSRWPEWLLCLLSESCLDLQQHLTDLSHVGPCPPVIIPGSLYQSSDLISGHESLQRRPVLLVSDSIDVLVATHAGKVRFTQKLESQDTETVDITLLVINGVVECFGGHVLQSGDGVGVEHLFLVAQVLLGQSA